MEAKVGSTDSEIPVVPERIRRANNARGDQCITDSQSRVPQIGVSHRGATQMDLSFSGCISGIP